MIYKKKSILLGFLLMASLKLEPSQSYSYEKCIFKKGDHEFVELSAVLKRWPKALRLFIRESASFGISVPTTILIWVVLYQLFFTEVTGWGFPLFRGINLRASFYGSDAAFVSFIVFLIFFISTPTVSYRISEKIFTNFDCMIDIKKVDKIISLYKSGKLLANPQAISAIEFLVKFNQMLSRSDKKKMLDALRLLSLSRT